MSDAPNTDDEGYLRLAYSALDVEPIDDEQPEVLPADFYYPEVLDLWNAGMPGGDKTGWRSVDPFYTVVPGQLTIITGWPGSGKSEWLDHLLINLSLQEWKFVMYSAENQPVQLHVAKLMEKLARAPFAEGVHARIPYDQLSNYAQELAQNFHFISPKIDAIPMRKIINVAMPILMKDDGKKAGLIIDPWNELEHTRPKHKSETEYIGESLGYIRNWARNHNVHVWIVAHPAKQPRDEGKLPIPTPDMISGSQHWWNKADCAITVYRPPVDQESAFSKEVQIHIQKIRFKNVGKLGKVILQYDKVTGRYSE